MFPNLICLLILFLTSVSYLYLFYPTSVPVSECLRWCLQGLFYFFLKDFSQALRWFSSGLLMFRWWKIIPFLLFTNGIAYELSLTPFWSTWALIWYSSQWQFIGRDSKTHMARLDLNMISGPLSFLWIGIFGRGSSGLHPDAVDNALLLRIIFPGWD